MHVLRYLALMLCVELYHGQLIQRKNPLLSRKRRYLIFPEGSNFVMTMSFVKSVMIKVPRLINLLGECDVPFKLPSDPRTFREKKIRRRTHYRQRREIYSQLAKGLMAYGLDGNACVKRMLCDAQNYLPPKGTSLVADLLSAVFTISVDDSFEDEENQVFHNYCHNSTYYNCPVPLMHYIMGSLMPK